MSRKQVEHALQGQLEAALPKLAAAEATNDRCTPACRKHIRDLQCVMWTLQNDATSTHICSRFCQHKWALCQHPHASRKQWGPYSYYYCDQHQRLHLCGSYCNRSFVVEEDGKLVCGFTGLALARQYGHHMVRATLHRMVGVDQFVVQVRVLSHRARWNHERTGKTPRAANEIQPGVSHWVSHVQAVQRWAWAGQWVVCGCPDLEIGGHQSENETQIQNERMALTMVFKEANRDARLMARCVVSTLLSSPQFAVVLQRRSKTLIAKAIKDGVEQIKKAVPHTRVFLPNLIKQLYNRHFPSQTIRMSVSCFISVCESIANKLVDFWTVRLFTPPPHCVLLIFTCISVQIHFVHTPLSAEAVTALMFILSEGWNSRTLCVRRNDFLAAVLTPRRSLDLWGLNPQGKYDFLFTTHVSRSHTTQQCFEKKRLLCTAPHS